MRSISWKRGKVELERGVGGYNVSRASSFRPIDFADTKWSETQGWKGEELRKGKSW